MKKDDRLLFGMLVYYLAMTVLYLPIHLMILPFDPAKLLFGYNTGIFYGAIFSFFHSSLYTFNIFIFFWAVSFRAIGSIRKGGIAAPLVVALLVLSDIPSIIDCLILYIDEGLVGDNIYYICSLVLTLIFDAVFIAIIVRYLLRHRDGFIVTQITDTALRKKVGAAMLAEAVVSIIAIVFGKPELLINNFSSTKAVDYFLGEGATFAPLWVFAIAYLLILAFCAVMIMRGANDALPIAASLHIFDALALSASILYRATRSSGNGVWDVVGLCVHLVIDIAIIWAVLKIEQNSKLAEKQA